MKIRPVGAELLHADGQTEMTKPIVAFRNFANATKDTNFALLGHYAASSGHFVL